MSNVDDLEREAYRHLDECKFAEAREAYRRAVLAKTPSKATLLNLHAAESGDRMGFARFIAQRYPADMRCRIDEARTMVNCKSYGRAVTLCTDLLPLAGTPNEEMEVRWLRLVAASHGRRHYLEFLEDFRAIWRTGDDHEVARFYRHELLVAIAGLENREALPMLEELEKEEWGTAGVGELMRIKIAELRLLAGVDRGLGLRKLAARLHKEADERRERGEDDQGRCG